MTALEPEALTWAGLLAQWVDFARASLAMPEEADSGRWRDSVVPVINLQAVTFALADLARIEAADRPVARDRAEILIRDSFRQLDEAWGREPMPGQVLEILEDARRALERSIFVGVTELRWPGPGVMEMPAIEFEAGGTIALMTPGTLVMPGEPIAWWAERRGIAVDGCQAEAVTRPRQVYRQIDDQGMITGDVIAPIESALPPGMPLLVPLFQCGRPIGHFTLERDDWLARQHAAMQGETIPVRVED